MGGEVIFLFQLGNSFLITNWVIGNVIICEVKSQLFIYNGIDMGGEVSSLFLDVVGNSYSNPKNQNNCDSTNQINDLYLTRCSNGWIMGGVVSP